MRKGFFYGKGAASTTTSLRSFRNFNVNQPKRVESEQKNEPEQVPISMDPSTQSMEAAKQDTTNEFDDAEEEEEEPLPGDKLRMEYEMQGKGWTPINKDLEPIKEANDIGNELDMQLNRDVIQKIASKLSIKVPFKQVQQILQRHHVPQVATITNLKKTAHDLMAIFDRETRTVVPPKYRTRLIQMLARAMHAYIVSKHAVLIGSGSRLKKRLDPNAYHPHAQAFLRGLTLAMKPAMSLGATALSLSPSVTGKLVAPFLQAAASTL